MSDSWVWDGSAWAPARSNGAPGRAEAAAAYDSASSDVVVFGGAGGGGSGLSDTELATATEQQPGSPTASSGSTPTTTAPPGPGTVGSSTSTPSGRTTPTTAKSTTGQLTTSTTATTGQPTTSPGASVVPGPVGPSMSLQTSLHNVRRGATVRLAGSGFQPGANITISFHSAPALVGHTLAGPLGDFTTTVSVPRSASPGEHHFVATGVAPDGKVTALLASVFVLAPPSSRGTSTEVKAAMVLTALLIPAATWLGMTVIARRRRSAG